MNTRLTPALALVGVLAIASGGALAAGQEENREATALQGAKVSLTRAIAIAERQTAGTAYDAGVDVKGAQTRIAVETNGPRGVQTVIVDAQSGQVVGTHAGGETD